MAVERLMFRPTEVAEAIGMSRASAYELIRAGEIPSVRIGGRIRVPVDALREWINRQLAERTSAHVGVQTPVTGGAGR